MKADHVAGGFPDEVAAFLEEHPGSSIDRYGIARCTVSGVEFSITLIDGPEPVLRIECDLGGISAHDPRALSWLLQEGFEPWVHARIRFGYDGFRKKAIASCVLHPQAADLLDSIIPLMIEATDLPRQTILQGELPRLPLEFLERELLAIRP